MQIYAQMRVQGSPQLNLAQTPGGFIQPFQTSIYHCHFHPLQAANYCRNSRLVVNEDDLKKVEK